MLTMLWDWIAQGILVFLRVEGHKETYPQPLTAEEEAFCLEQLQSGSLHEKSEAREKLIVHNLRLVSFFAWRWKRDWIEQEDLRSIGKIGLINGVDSYNPQKKVKLSSYLGVCIENAIKMTVVRKVPPPTTSIYTQQGEGKRMLIEMEGEEDSIQLDLEREEICALVRKILAAMEDERERLVLEMRHGFWGDPMTQKEIAVALTTLGFPGVSRSCVSRIEKNARKNFAKTLERELEGKNWAF